MIILMLFLQQDVELALKKSSAKWKIVVGHHAIRSIGHHGDTQELINHLLPILQVYKHKLDPSVAKTEDA